MALTPSFFLFFFFSSLILVCFTRAQGRAPHGLAHENPVAFSPSAVDFFHPTPQDQPNGESPCAASSSCSPFPLPAHSVVVATDQARKISTSQKGGDHRLRAGGAAGFVLGVAFAVLLTVAVYHLLVTRKANSNRPNGCSSSGC